MINEPSYMNFFEFKKNENIKEMAKDILNGKLTFDDEDDRLN